MCHKTSYVPFIHSCYMGYELNNVRHVSFYVFSYFSSHYKNDNSVIFRMFTINRCPPLWGNLALPHELSAHFVA